MSGTRTWFSNDNDGVSISKRDDHVRVTLSSEQSKLTMEAVGEIECGIDERSITGIERGGYVEITERTPHWRREVDIERGPDGLAYDYRQDGDKIPMDDAAREWRGDAILTLIRVSGVNIEQRVARIGKNQGVDALIEVAAYCRGNDELKDAYIDAAAGLSSDHERSRALTAVGETTRTGQRSSKTWY